MKKIFPYILAALFAIAPFADVAAQKNKDKIEMPQYPGGEKELHKYIMNELRYPQEAMLNKETGEVLVAFSIGMDGYVSGVRVIKSVSPSLDEEAIRVVRKMPSWIPGKKNGRAVRAEMTIPINFKVIYQNGKFTGEQYEAEQLRDMLR